MARSDRMSPAELRRWRFYAESLIEQAISIIGTLDAGEESSLASPAGGEGQIIGCARADGDREWTNGGQFKDEFCTPARA